MDDDDDERDKTLASVEVIKEPLAVLERLTDDRFNVPEKEDPALATFKNVRYQILASGICSLTIVQAGLNMSYSSVLLPQLADDARYNISKHEASWIAGIAVLTTPVGSLLCGPIMDRIGRKAGLIAGCLLSLIGWILTYFATPETFIPMLYTARAFGGFGGGMTTIFLVYTPEVCHEQYRPMLLGLNSAAVSLGVLLVTVTGMCMGWKMMATCYGLFTAVNIILIWVMVPESPFWLMTLSRNISRRRELAEKSLRMLNPNNQMYERQLTQLITVNRNKELLRENIKSKGFSLNMLKATILKFIMPPATLPVLLLTGLILLQQLSGGYSIIFYTINIFQKMGGKFGGGLNEYHALLMVGVVRFIMSTISAGLSRIIGRRPLLMSSTIGMALSCIMIPLYHYMDSNLKKPEESQVKEHWFPMVCVLLFVAWSAIGLLNIPWTLIGEVLPTSIRGVGSGFFISLAYILMFGIVKAFPFIMDVISINTIFLLQGIVCIITLIYVYFFVPETLGKSLAEIQKHFSKK